MPGTFEPAMRMKCLASLLRNEIMAWAAAQNATVALAFPVVGGWNVRDVIVEGLTADGKRKKAEVTAGGRRSGKSSRPP